MADDSKEKIQEVAIAALFKDLPAAYPNRHAAVLAISRMFHKQLAAVIQESLAPQIALLPEMDVHTRKQWIHDLSNQLQQIHLALRCPRTGQPATMEAMFSNVSKTRLRYAFLPIQTKEQGKTGISHHSPRLPAFHIVAVEQPVEGHARTLRRDEHGSSAQR